MTTHLDEQNAESTARWRQRPAISAAVRVAIAAVPLAVSVAVAVIFENVVPEPHASFGKILWWLGVLGSSTVVLLGAERSARRALPLAALLKMGMLFPGAAPKRLAVARRAASTRGLERRLAEARSMGLDNEPVLAAQSIVSLASSLSAHDRKTRGHTERVRALTDLVADELGLAENDRDRLRWSALLHDVGKLAVHPDILNKEGSLSDEEWDLVRQHPIEGAKLTAPLAAWLGPWSATIAEHHERYDGSGYPYGLAGESISLGGRIVAVVDAYDVMTSTRSYKNPCSPEAARMELARCAGTQFDPVVVRAFLAVPVRNLRSLLPLSWLGSLRIGDFGSPLALAGRAAVALLVAGGIVGITASKPWQSHGTAEAASNPGSSGGSGGDDGSAGTETGGTGGSGGSSNTNGSTDGGEGGNSGGSGGGSGSDGAGSLAGPGGTSGGKGANGSGSGSTTTYPGEPGSTYQGVTGSGPPGSSPSTYPGSTPTTGGDPTPTTGPGPTPTTGPGSPPTTSPPPPTSTTSPPPAPPTGLNASATCQVLGLLEPGVTLKWTDSTSDFVSGYQVLISTNGGSSYTVVATIGKHASPYTDTKNIQNHIPYVFKIEALSPDGDVGSNSASVTVNCFL
jgi:putative nucleotidyltransferase with HDIG domain